MWRFTTESILTNKHILLGVTGSLWLLLSGCLGVSSLPITPTLPAATPSWIITSTFTPAETFTDGLSEVPEDKYLFVEFLTYYDAEGDCPQVFRDFPYYQFSAGKLTGSIVHDSDFKPEIPIIGYYGRRDAPAPGMGSGEYSTLSVIQSLPYEHPYPQPVTIHSVDREGTIVAAVEGNTMRLRAGESWFRREEYESGPGCRPITTYSLINYGLLDEDQIELWVNDR